MLHRVFLSIVTFLTKTKISTNMFTFILIVKIIPHVLQYDEVRGVVLVRGIVVYNIITNGVSSILSATCGLNFTGVPGMPMDGVYKGVVVTVCKLYINVFINYVTITLTRVLRAFPVVCGHVGLHTNLKVVIVSVTVKGTLKTLCCFLAKFITAS